MTPFTRKIFRKQTLLLLVMLAAAGTAVFGQQRYEYKVIATNKTSTMQKEMSEAADAGYHLEKVMGGNTEFGGSEVVVVMSKDSAESNSGRYVYKLLATSKT